MTGTAAPPMPYVTGPEMTESYEPFSKFCPRCQTNVTTRVEEFRGNCWWIVCVLGCVFFLPLCYWLCCQSSKDAKHMCPSCGSVLAIKKGGCS